MAIRTVGVAIKPGETRALAAVRDLAKWLAERRVRACFEPEAAAAIGEVGISLKYVSARIERAARPAQAS